MAKCDFSINFSVESSILIQKAAAAINNAGGIFNGGPEGGNFSVSTPLGNIAGGYVVSGQTIFFTISDKPFLLSCGRIEDEMRKYIV